MVVSVLIRLIVYIGNVEAIIQCAIVIRSVISRSSVIGGFAEEFVGLSMVVKNMVIILINISIAGVYLHLGEQVNTCTNDGL